MRERRPNQSNGSPATSCVLIVNIVPSWNYTDTHFSRTFPDKQLMVGFANSRAGLLITPSPAFPTKSEEIERKANGARFLWTPANGNAYASAPKCLSGVGSQSAKQFCASGRQENCIGSQSKFARLCPGT